MQTRGGALKSAMSEDSLPKGVVNVVASLWGAGGVLYILGKAIKRVVPIAMEPFHEGAMPLTQLQLGYVLMFCDCKIMVAIVMTLIKISNSPPVALLLFLDGLLVHTFSPAFGLHTWRDTRDFNRSLVHLW